MRRQVGVVFQTQSLDKALTVEENLRAQGHLHGLSGAVLRDRMERAMERLGLADRRKDLVETLSGGLRRRVEIAKALLHQPQVLLMDEASTGLDPAARRDLSRHVENLRDSEGVTILLTTHILEEADRCDRLVLLHQGKIVAQGSPAELRSRIGGDVVVLEPATRATLAAGIERALRPAAHRRATARCAWRSRTAIASSPKWWRRFPARSNRWACTSPRWKTCSCAKRERPLSSFFLPAATLWQRELVRFWRQKSRVLGVVASPLVFWLLIGYGSNDLARFYSGALVLTVMFSAIFSTISIIEDRREGFLLSMLVSPAPRTSLVLGKILGAATLAWIQGLIFLAFAPLAGVRIGLLELIPVAARDFSDFVHAHRPGLRDRLEDGFHLRLSRHHEPAAGAHVDGLGLAVPHGDGARLGEGHHVGQSADLFDRPVELHAAAAQRLAGRGGEPDGDRRLRPGAAAGIGHDGGAEGHAQRGMRNTLTRRRGDAEQHAENSIV